MTQEVISFEGFKLLFKQESATLEFVVDEAVGTGLIAKLNIYQIGKRNLSCNLVSTGKSWNFKM